MTEERDANVEIRSGVPTANTDAGQIRTRSAVSRRSGPTQGPTSRSNDIMIKGTIAPCAPNKTIIRGSGLEDFESFGRAALRGVATGKLSSAGPNGPVKRARGLRSLCIGSLRRLATTFRNLSRHDRQGSLKGARSQQRSTLFDEYPSATRRSWF